MKTNNKSQFSMTSKTIEKYELNLCLQNFIKYIEIPFSEKANITSRSESNIVHLYNSLSPIATYEKRIKKKSS